MGSQIPTTDDEIAQLVADKPDFWEYLLWAGVLQTQMARHEPAYRDHLLRHAPPADKPLDWPATIAMLQQSFADFQVIVGQLEAPFDRDIHLRAFGPLGEHGDADLIEHMARRTVDTYRRMIDLGLDVRAARVPAEARTAVNLAADFNREPIEQIRAFVRNVVASIDAALSELARHPAREAPLELTLQLELHADDDLIARYQAELDRLLT